MQSDFTEGGALGVDGGAAVARGVTEFLRDHRAEYALVAASRDWHDAEGADPAGAGANGGHFAAPGTEPDFVTTWPPHCVAGTVGAEYHPALDQTLLDVHVRKGMGVPAYSAFEGVTAPGGRPLAEVLAAAGVTEVDVVGIATDYCVRATALDALAAGLAVRVLTGLVAGVAPDTSAAALAELAAAGVTLA